MLFISRGIIPVAASVPQTGLDFNVDNDNAAGTIQFRFTSTNKPPINDATYIHRIYVRQQAGYYTTFFNARGDGSFVGDGTYFGCHPYPNPPPSSTDHLWEVSIGGTDVTTELNAYDNTVQYGRFYTQIVRVYASGGNTVVDFHYDISAGSDRIVRADLGFALTEPTDSPALTYGDAPWSETNERLYGIIRGLQIYSPCLSLANALLEAANHSSNTPVTASGITNKWYMNQNPTPSDISDKSGAGHNPAWINANRPTLWTP